jgi:hypothetical protein
LSCQIPALTSIWKQGCGHPQPRLDHRSPPPLSEPLHRRGWVVPRLEVPPRHRRCHYPTIVGRAGREEVAQVGMGPNEQWRGQRNVHSNSRPQDHRALPWVATGVTSRFVPTSQSTQHYTYRYTTSTLLSLTYLSNHLIVGKVLSLCRCNRGDYNRISS